MNHIIETQTTDRKSILLNVLEIESSTQSSQHGVIVRMKSGDNHWLDLTNRELVAKIKAAMSP